MTDQNPFVEQPAKTNYLNWMEPVAQQKVMAIAQEQVLDDQQKVFQEGEAGDALYIILEGAASVYMEDLGQQKRVARLRTGNLFGEMSVITSQPRTATVIAEGRLRLLRIPKTEMLHILSQFPTLREKIAKLGVARSEDTLEKMFGND